MREQVEENVLDDGLSKARNYMTNNPLTCKAVHDVYDPEHKSLWNWIF